MAAAGSTARSSRGIDQDHEQHGENDPGGTARPRHAADEDESARPPRHRVEPEPPAPRREAPRRWRYGHEASAQDGSLSTVRNRATEVRRKEQPDGTTSPRRLPCRDIREPRRISVTTTSAAAETAAAQRKCSRCRGSCETPPRRARREPPQPSRKMSTRHTGWRVMRRSGYAASIAESVPASMAFACAQPRGRRPHLLGARRFGPRSLHRALRMRRVARMRTTSAATLQPATRKNVERFPASPSRRRPTR